MLNVDDFTCITVNDISAVVNRTADFSHYVIHITDCITAMTSGEINSSFAAYITLIGLVRSKIKSVTLATIHDPKLTILSYLIRYI